MHVFARMTVDSVLGPALVDHVTNFGGHLDAPGPFAGGLAGQLVRRVDAELPTEKASAAWSSLSSGPSASTTSCLVDVRTDMEEHPLVVEVDELVHHDDGLREREHPEPPNRVHDLACMTVGNALRIETIMQLWKAPATGRS